MDKSLLMLYGTTLLFSFFYLLWVNPVFEIIFICYEFFDKTKL